MLITELGIDENAMHLPLISASSLLIRTVPIVLGNF